MNYYSGHFVFCSLFSVLCPDFCPKVSSVHHSFILFFHLQFRLSSCTSFLQHNSKNRAFQTAIPYTPLFALSTQPGKPGPSPAAGPHVSTRNPQATSSHRKNRQGSKYPQSTARTSLLLPCIYSTYHSGDSLTAPLALYARQHRLAGKSSPNDSRFVPSVALFFYPPHLSGLFPELLTHSLLFPVLQPLFCCPTHGRFVTSIT